MNQRDSLRKPTSFGTRVVTVIFLSSMVFVLSIYVGLMSRLAWGGFSWGWDLFGL